MKVAVASELDDVTLARARTGDRAALELLIEMYQDRVFALIWRMLLGGRDRTHDLAQETFVRVLRGIAGFDPRGTAKLSTWILTIATRVVMNERRRAGRDKAELDPDAITAVAYIDDTVERKRIAEALIAGIAKLPDDQRAVFVLREYHELEYADIAAALELPENTVRSRLHRARTALRDELRARGVEP
ncbi:MAG TPA: sigma-70 family RNA polymerase sigma factor [Kofleriaceae bacterium]